jgi:predicted signal transduction protein with EAL and GGDEF domain
VTVACPLAHHRGIKSEGPRKERRTDHGSVVAEGVETVEQAEELARLGCKLAQGYHFARPLDPEEVSEFLRARSQLL